MESKEKRVPVSKIAARETAPTIDNSNDNIAQNENITRKQDGMGDVNVHPIFKNIIKIVLFRGRLS